MKKIFLVIILGLLISVSGNSQWYKDKYHVKNIRELSQEQLNEGLRYSKIGATTGIVLSCMGIIGIGVGSYLIRHEGSKELHGTGDSIVLISLPTEVAGLAIWAVNRLRKESINELLNSTELKIGLINYQSGNICSGIKGSLLPCLSVTIRF